MNNFKHYSIIALLISFLVVVLVLFLIFIENTLKMMGVDSIYAFWLSRFAVGLLFIFFIYKVKHS